MLSLSQAQQRAIAHSIFVDRMAHLLHEHFPEDCPAQDDPQLRQFLRTQFDLAQSYGLDTEREVATFIMGGWLLGEGFDYEVQAIAECLARPDLPADTKAAMLSSLTEKICALPDD